MRRWLILNGMLGLIVAGLTIQIVRTWLRTLPPVDVPAPGKAPEAPARSGETGKRSKRAQAEKAPLTPPALVTAIVAKDLFDVSRQKPSDDAKVAAPVHETAPPPGVTLVGVRAWGKDREGFLLDSTQSNTQRRVRVGDAVGNFTVKTIRPRSVLLVSQAGDEVTLKLEADLARGAALPGAPTRPGRPGVVAAGGPSSPAAGVQGAPTAAGSGGAKPAVAGNVPGVPPQPPVPGTPQPPAAGGKPPTAAGGAPSPAVGAKPGAVPSQLPSAVRERLENLKKEQQRIQGMPQGGETP